MAASEAGARAQARLHEVCVDRRRPEQRGDRAVLFDRRASGHDQVVVARFDRVERAGAQLSGARLDACLAPCKRSAGGKTVRPELHVCGADDPLEHHNV
ncbi:hypothetical protein, partial [Burkholderia pseudomallei]|uniref:hypothetical protein n=1 Tax=Burkholderia pseudomallei TaxID=28450 RepID=UPI00387DD53E